MNIGFQLYQLQQIDSKIDRAQSRINVIVYELAENESIKKAENNFESSEKDYIQRKNDFENLNTEIQAKKNKKEQSESSMYGGSVTNPKELQDLQQEINSLSGIIRKMEDDLLEKLIALEDSEQKLKTARDNLKSARSNFATQESLYTGEKRKLLKEIENQQSQRETLLGGIDRTVLKMYESLRKSKNGTAVSLIDDEACSACGTSLTPSQKQKARSANAVFTCPSCGRIIYGS